MSEIPHVTGENFKTEVLESNQPVIVDFTAVWCGPCKMLEPVIRDLVVLWDGKVKVVKLDVDSNTDIAMQYHVMGIPTLMLFVDGELKETLTGYQTRNRIEKKFSSYITI